MNWKPRGGAQLTRVFSAAVRFVAPITRRTWPARLCKFFRWLHVTAAHPTQLFNDSGLREQALIIIGQPDSLILATKLRNAFSALAVNNLGHVDIHVTHVVPHNLRPSAFAQNG